MELLDFISVAIGNEIRQLSQDYDTNAYLLLFLDYFLTILGVVLLIYGVKAINFLYTIAGFIIGVYGYYLIITIIYLNVTSLNQIVDHNSAIDIIEEANIKYHIRRYYALILALTISVVSTVFDSIGMIMLGLVTGTLISFIVGLLAFNSNLFLLLITILPVISTATSIYFRNISKVIYCILAGGSFLAFGLRLSFHGNVLLSASYKFLKDVFFSANIIMLVILISYMLIYLIFYFYWDFNE